jgi:hypothetical protein
MFTQRQSNARNSCFPRTFSQQLSPNGFLPKAFSQGGACVPPGQARRRTPTAVVAGKLPAPIKNTRQKHVNWLCQGGGETRNSRNDQYEWMGLEISVAVSEKSVNSSPK